MMESHPRTGGVREGTATLRPPITDMSSWARPWKGHSPVHTPSTGVGVAFVHFLVVEGPCNHVVETLLIPCPVRRNSQL